jgi:5-hydroxyisourate hydrolase
MTQITSHILDTSVGKPAEGVLITLMQQEGDDWQVLGSGETNADGRVADFKYDKGKLPGGVYKLNFALSDYYSAMKRSSFYPFVDVVFEIDSDGQHYHVPLLLNPYGYSTYRGS